MLGTGIMMIILTLSPAGVEQVEVHLHNINVFMGADKTPRPKDQLIFSRAEKETSSFLLKWR